MPATVDGATPQPVVTELSAAAVILVATIAPGGEDAVRELLPDLAGLSREVGFGFPDGRLAAVTAIGSAAWDRLFPGTGGRPARRPALLHPFEALQGPRHLAPATPGDLLFHIRAATLDLCFEWARRLADRLGDAIEVVDEVHGFRYYDRRDLLGFVDGTENPEGADALATALVDPALDPGFAMGSYVLVQKYLHDLGAWNALSVTEQERVIGRSKLGNVEMADDVKPPDSHLALNVITGPDGEELQILRFNMPFGTVRDGGSGTYFIAYCATPDPIEQMLRAMFLGDEAGNRNRILDFSTAVTGGLFFAPSADFLDDPDAATAAEDASEDAAGNAPGNAVDNTVAVLEAADGSLRIGSLKASTAP